MSISPIDGNLLSSIPRTGGTYPVPKVTSNSDKVQLPEEEKQIVPEEKARDRYDTTLSDANKESLQSLNQQGEAVAKDNMGPGKQQVKDLVAAQSLDDAIASNTGVSPAIADAKESTVATRTRDIVSQLHIEENDMAKLNLERADKQDYIRSPVQEIKQEAVQMEKAPTPQAIEKQQAHLENPEHTQNSLELQSTREVQDRDLVQMDPIQLETFEPKEVTIQERKADTVEMQENNQLRETVMQDSPVQEQKAVEYEREVNIELQAKMKARTDMLSEIPVAPEPAAEISTPVVVEPKFDTVVADQQIETGPQPTVASVKTDGAVNEAVAVPKAMLEHYAPAEIEAQPMAEINVDTPVDTTTKYTPEKFENRYTSEQVELEQREQIEYDVPTPVQYEEIEPVKSQAEAPEPVEVKVQEPMPQIQDVETNAAREGVASEAVAAETKQQVQQEPQELPSAEEYFAPLPGSGASGGGETVVNDPAEYFPELPGSGSVSGEESAVASSEEYFAPLPGSGENGNPELMTPLPGSSDNVTEEYFEPLPGSSETSAHTQQLAENNILTEKTDYEEFEELFETGVATISPDELAYLQTGAADSQYALLSGQYAQNISGEAYDPFETIDEMVQKEWVQEAMNQGVNSRFMVNSQIGEEMDFSEFEEQYSETEDQSIEMEDYLRAQFNRVLEYEVKEEMTQRDLKDLFT